MSNMPDEMVGREFVPLLSKMLSIMRHELQTTDTDEITTHFHDDSCKYGDPYAPVCTCKPYELVLRKNEPVPSVSDVLAQLKANGVNVNDRE